MHVDVIKAWKDREYRESLSAEEQAMLPENPIGEIELSDEELHQVHGANGGSYGGCHSHHCYHHSWRHGSYYHSWHHGHYSWHHGGCH